MSQTPKENKGLWIQVYDKNSQDPVSKNFISFETIKTLPVDSALTKIKNEKTTKTWFGANFCELLETINVSCQKIQKLSISAPDGYTSVLSGELLSSLKTAIYAYRAQNQTDWNENYGYMRLIFPDLRSMYWVNSPNKMVITLGQDHQTVHHLQFNFVDNARLSQLIKKDLKGNPYFVIDDLLVELNLPQNDFHVLTADGLYREYPENEINRYLILKLNQQQDGNWEINGINVPHGLKTRELFFLSSGNKGIFLKELTDDEQQKWENIFWQPFVGENFSVKDLIIEKVLSDRNKISLELTNKLSDKQLPLYQLFKNEQKRHQNIDYFVVSW